ncbi:TonB-dependent receptor [Billgrantia azerbaijanica]|nr:TonB-dependent receptor [Halomonas azerbaijanica]
MATVPRAAVTLALRGGMLLAAVIGSTPLAAAEGARLDTLVVTATGSEQRLWGVPAAVTVIDGERLRERPARDVLEMIRGTPGVSLAGVGLAGRKTLQLRGMESHQSLILIDGKRVNPSDAVIGHSDYQHGWVPPEAIERIEIVRGPMSSLYGSEALGGVVNIITKPVPERWSGSGRLLGGTRDDGRGGERGQLAVNLGGPLVADRLALSLNASLQRQAATPEAEQPELTELEGRELTAGGLSLSFTPNANHRFTLDYDRSDEERWRDTLHRGRQPVHESRYDLDREHASLTHNGRFGALETQLRGYRSSLEAVNRTDQGVSPSAPQTLTDDIVDGHLRLPLGGSHLLTLGGEYRIETLEHEALDGGEESLDYRALFAQDEWRLGEALNLTLGVRADHHELFGTEASPRAYLVYHPTDSLSLKAGYGHGFRAPTIKQISPEYRFVGPHSFVGNPDLEPERSDSYELGAEYWHGGFSAGVTLFQNDVRDLIVNQCAQNCDQRLGRLFAHVNIDSARIRGIESVVESELGSGFSLAANHTYLATEDRDSGEDLPGRPRHAVGLRLGWEHPALGLTANLRAEYTGEQTVLVNDAAEELPGYTLWHAGIAKALGAHLTLRAGVENLTDEQPLETSPHFTYPEQGRFYFVSLDARF